MGFESFLGNREAVRAVREMLASGRVPGALLFTGPEGVGKKTLATMFAKALNCERRQPGGDNFCAECARCRQTEEMLAAAREDLTRRREFQDAQRRVEGLVYFDVQLIEPITRYILIEQIRRLREVAYTRPFHFLRRVFILDQAQAIHWQAADLLLKTLEEPPETTTVVLVCPNVYELRPTIRSRCARLQFAPVEEAILTELLAREGKLTKQQKALAARVAAGSVARAKAFDAREFERRREPWLVLLENLARPAPSPRRPDWKAIFDATKSLTESRDELEETLRIGYALLRDLMLLAEGSQDRDVVNTDLLARLRPLAKGLGFTGIGKLKEGLDQAYKLQTRNVNQQLTLDALALEMLLGSGGEPAGASRSGR